MHDHIPQVDEYPFATVFAFGREDFAARFAYLVFDVARQ